MVNVMVAHNLAREENLGSGVAKEERRFKTFRESFTVLLFDLGGILAGSIAAYYISLVLIRPWVIMIYPLVLGVRGAINGVLSGRLSTGLHVRLIEPSLTRNTKYYYAVMASIYSLSLISSVTVGLIAFVTSSILYGTGVDELGLIIFTCVATKAIAVLVTVPFTSLLGFLSYKRGLDPDVFVYPISSTLADIWATMSYVLMLALGFWYGPIGNLLVYGLGGGFFVAVAFLAYSFRKEREYWKTLKEAFMGVLIITFIEAFAGLFLSRIRSYIKKSPGIVTVYPALTGTIGDGAAIFGSLSTTKLVVGLIETKLSGIKDEVKDLLQIGSAVMIMYVIYGFISFLNERTLVPFAVIMLSFFILFPIIATISFSMAILTFMKGLDPDNFVIPFETAVTDSLLTLVLSSLIIIFYVA